MPVTFAPVATAPIFDQFAQRVTYQRAVDAIGPVTLVNASSISNNSATATPYSVTLNVAVNAGDLIVVCAAGNGTHVTNGMSVQDSVNATPFTTILETQGGSSSSRWLQTFAFVTPVALATSDLITFTPYALSGANSFSVQIFRSASATIDQAAAGNSNPLAQFSVAPPLPGNPHVGSLVVSFCMDGSGTLTPQAPFVKGSAATSNNASAIAYVLSADDDTTYPQTWTQGTANTSAAQTVAFLASSGTGWTQTPTDSAGLTDSAILDRSNVITDDTGLTDTTALTQTHITTDDAGLTDSATVQNAKLITQTDDSGLTDSVVFSRTLAQTDSAGLTDTTALSRLSVVTDSAGLTDTAQLDSGRLITQTDDAGLTDSTALARTLVATDSAGLTDSQAVSHTVTLTDLAGLTDTTTLLLAKLITATDSAGLTDTAVTTLIPGATVVPAYVSVDGSATGGSLDSRATGSSTDGASTPTGDLDGLAMAGATDGTTTASGYL